MTPEFLRAKSARKASARVPNRFKLNQPGTLNLKRGKAHLRPILDRPAHVRADRGNRARSEQTFCQYARTVLPFNKIYLGIINDSSPF